MEDTLPCLFYDIYATVLSTYSFLHHSAYGVKGRGGKAAKAFSKAALAGILTRNSIITPRRGDHIKMGGTDGKLSISESANSFIDISAREQEEHCSMTSLAHTLRICLCGFCGVGCSRCHHRLPIGHVGRHSEGALSRAQNR